MLNKLKEIHDIANKLWHEDAYDTTIICSSKGWSLVVKHRYLGKTSFQPESTVFDKPITDETVDIIISELKTSFITRASSLADFRKKDCDAIYEKLKAATDEYTKRLFLLDEVKKI